MLCYILVCSVYCECISFFHLAPTWSEWGDWSECSSTCSGGMRSRTRRCINGNSCTGVNVQHQECNTNVSCTRKYNITRIMYNVHVASVYSYKGC